MYMYIIVKLKKKEFCQKTWGQRSHTSDHIQSEPHPNDPATVTSAN